MSPEPPGAGQAWEIARGQVVPLDGGALVGLVESGCLVIQARTGPAPDAPLRRLATLRAGEAVLGVRPGVIPPGSLFLVAVGASRVRVHAADGAGAFPADLARPLDLLLQELLSNFARMIPQDIRTTESAEGVELAAGDAWRPAAGLAWVRVERGRVYPLGTEAAAAAPGSPAFPLSQDGWLIAAEPSRIAARREVGASAGMAAQDPAALAAGIERLAAALVGLVEREARISAEEAASAIAAGARLAASSLGGALRRLAALLGEAAPPEEDRGEPALVAAIRPIAAALGATLVAPPAAAGPVTIEALAEASGLRARRVILEPDWWTFDCGPLLAAEGERPLALVREGGRYFAFDPASYAWSPADAALAGRLAPHATAFSAALPEARADARGLLRHALSPVRREAAAILGWGLAASLLGVLAPALTSGIIDVIIPEGRAGLLLQAALALSLAALGAAVFRLVQAEASARLEIVAAERAQAAVVDRLLRLGLPFFRERAAGDVLARVLAVADVRRAVGGSMLRSLLSGAMAIVYLGLLVSIDPNLAAIAVSTTALSLAIGALVGAQVARGAAELRQREAALTAEIVQIISGVAKLRIAAAEERALARWADRFAGNVARDLRLRSLENASVVSRQLLPHVGTAALFAAIAGSLGAGGGMSPGTLLAFYAAYGAFQAGANDVAASATGLVNAAAHGRLIRPLLAAQPEVAAGRAAPGRLRGRIELEHVDFAYRPDGPLALRGVSLRVEPGEHVALVGPSGSGKSSIIRLILGFEQPRSGRVRLDGRDLAELDAAAVRRQIGVVLQNTRVGGGALQEVIAGGARAAPDEILEAARAAGLGADIDAMPMGLHTIVSEGGTNFSGGQRQRILIARALVKKPPILIFDEATSALDSETQAQVADEIDRLPVSRLVVAHRLSTIRRADRIYVIEAGQVAQTGTFDELAAQEGLFRRLIERQEL